MISEEILNYFAGFIEERLGMFYHKSNYYQLQNRLEEIIKYKCLKNADELYQIVKSGICKDFEQLIIDIVTNNETSFFREAKLFSSFSHIVEKQLTTDNIKKRHLKIWSAASSTGQEPLTIAMVLCELREKLKIPFSFTILATDISERVLSRAKEANYYHHEIQRGLNEELRHKYFNKVHGDRWQANNELTKYIEYKKLNLIKSTYPDDYFDHIFCRNVLIYQCVDNKILILNKLTNHLVPQGFLFLGSGENLLGLKQNYESSIMDGAVVYRKKEHEYKVA